MIAVYIHIPFCWQICAYCDFCKFLYNEKWVDNYLVALEKEVKQNYKGETVKSVYIGGGTPSALSLEQLEKLFKIINIFKLTENSEITFEANSTDLTDEKINFLKNKITRLSIGFQTNNPKYLKLINRSNNIKNIKKACMTFKNINIDLMYGFNGESVLELKKDLDLVLSFKPNHISAYALILEKNTKLYINNYCKNDDDDELLYNFLNDYLKGYIHYEFSNYALEGYESIHNLAYWNNEFYYGFGVSACGYINNVRYENVKSLNKYIQGEFLKNEHYVDKNEQIQNEFILGFRKLKGINVNDFYQKYNINPLDLEIVKWQLKQNLIIYKDGYIYINPKYLYVSNSILCDYLEAII